MIPSWVGPTVAISLLIIAASCVAIGIVALSIGIALHKQHAAWQIQFGAFTAEARALAVRLKGELEGFADLSTDARAKMKGAIETVDGRLKDLDALVEVLQEEAEETALDVASFVRTVRHTGGIIGAARRQMRKRGKD